MALTGQLGTTDSELGNIELASAGGPPRTRQSLQAKANIYGTSSQSLQARARITNSASQSIQARARIPLFVSIVTDSFNRSDSATLGTADSGQTWQYSGTLLYAIDTDQAKCTNGSGGGGAWIDSHYAGTATQPIQISVDCMNVGTGNATGLLFRSDGLASANKQFFTYLSKIAGVYNISVLRELAGSFGTLYQQPVVGVTVGDSEVHNLRVLDDGTNISVYLDDVFQTTVVATNFNSQTIQGIFVDSGGTADRLDNYNLRAIATMQEISAKARVLNTVTTDQSIQALARISTQTSQNIQAKAALTPQTLQRIQALANILNSVTRTLQAKARISPSISALARIVIPVTADLEIDFSVQVPATADLLINFDATALSRAIQSIAAKANIRLPVATDLTITFDVGCAQPTPPVLRPTERVAFRRVQTVSAKASIVQ